MGTSGGPALPNKDNLAFTHQPGETAAFNNRATITTASDVSTPSRGAVIGPRRTRNAGYGPAYDDSYNYNNLGPVLEIKNIPGSIYTINTATTSIYTISLWVKVVSFPTHYDSTGARSRGNTNTTRTKRASLARFNYSGTNLQRGWIEFGAMAPYYLNNNNVKNYKTTFQPISFGAAIAGPKKIYSVYTDYKFNLNQWYLVTLQIQTSSNFSAAYQDVTTKMFINEVQENIAQYNGIAWRQQWNLNTATTTHSLPKRKRGAVAAQPGFLNRATGGVVSNASSQTIILKYFPNLTNLNYISYSPFKTFITGGSRGITSNTNDGSTNPRFLSNRTPNQYQQGSGINFGQTYIYTTTFNTDLYTQFRYLYN